MVCACVEKVTSFKLKSKLFSVHTFSRIRGLRISPENTRSSPLMRARVSTDLLHMSSSSFSCSPFFLLLYKSTSCRVKCTATKISYIYSSSGNCAASVRICQFHFWGYINGNQTFILDSHRPSFAVCGIVIH
jgi:hypothetical protein